MSVFDSLPAHIQWIRSARRCRVNTGGSQHCRQHAPDDWKSESIAQGIAPLIVSGCSASCVPLRKVKRALKLQD
eukprot:6132438-Karenia_brevis.AAC.1